MVTYRGARWFRETTHVTPLTQRSKMEFRFIISTYRCLWGNCLYGQSTMVCYSSTQMLFASVISLPPPFRLRPPIYVPMCRVCRSLGHFGACRDFYTVIPDTRPNHLNEGLPNLLARSVQYKAITTPNTAIKVATLRSVCTTLMCDCASTSPIVT